MKPSDRAAVEDYLHAMDAAGAARELALLLHLDRDAEELVAWCIEESHEAAYHKAMSEMEKEETE